MKSVWINTFLVKGLGYKDIYTLTYIYSFFIPNYKKFNLLNVSMFFSSKITTQVSIYVTGAHQTFLNTQFTWEANIKRVGRGEVGITGYQPNVYAC